MAISKANQVILVLGIQNSRSTYDVSLGSKFHMLKQNYMAILLVAIRRNPVRKPKQQEIMYFVWWTYILVGFGKIGIRKS